MFIQLKNASKVYGQGESAVKALDGAELSAEQGEVIETASGAVKDSFGSRRQVKSVGLMPARRRVAFKQSTSASIVAAVNEVDAVDFAVFFGGAVGFQCDERVVVV